jgi:outer membrane protein OmpA-like peptidoglycan-associated protein
VRVAGIASIAAGALAQGSVIGKVDKLLAFDLGGVKVELSGELKAEISKRIESLSRFRPEYLGGIEGFAIGRASLDKEGFDGDSDALASAEQALRRICDAWRAQGERSDSLIIIVGGTDRLALAGIARARYEANAGLGQARAASLKRDLETRCLPPQATAPGRVVLLASGASTTPDRITPEERRLGHPRDRRVDIWVLSTGGSVVAATR